MGAEPMGPGGRPASDPIRARPWGRPQPPRRILAIRLHALGDTVITLPYLAALRRQLPDARIDMLTRREVGGIPGAVDLFDRVHQIGGGRSTAGQWSSALLLLPRLLAGRYDVVLDLQRNRISRFVRMALRPVAWSEFDRFSPRLAGERTRATIEAAGLGPLESAPLPVRLGKRPDTARLEGAGWDGVSGLIVLNPAGAFPDREWPIESYARFAELWLGRHPRTQFVVLGLPRLADKARALRERLGGRLIDLVGRTAPAEAFGILGGCRLVVSEDSGLMHMAWVAGVPTLALFGASRSAWARPHGERSACLDVCARGDDACMDGRCRAAPPRCLEALDPETVLERAHALVTQPPDPRPGRDGA